MAFCEGGEQRLPGLSEAFLGVVLFVAFTNTAFKNEIPGGDQKKAAQMTCSNKAIFTVCRVFSNSLGFVPSNKIAVVPGPCFVWPWLAMRLVSSGSSQLL